MTWYWWVAAILYTAMACFAFGVIMGATEAIPAKWWKRTLLGAAWVAMAALWPATALVGLGVARGEAP